MNSLGSRLPVLLTLFAGCQAKLFTIEVDESSETIVSQGTILEQIAGDMGFGDFLDMDVTAAQELRNQGVAPGDIQEVAIQSITLTATAPQDADLSFLSAIDVYVEAPDLPEVLVATLDAFPEGVAEAHLEIPDVDLTEYVLSQSMTFTTDVTGHRPDADTTVLAEVVVDVGVTGQGVCHNL